MLAVHNIAKMIDHSLLRPNLTLDAIRKGCDVAQKYNVASVCVRPCDIAYACQRLAGSEVLVGTVVGFPHGTHSTAVKAFEAEQALQQGAVELDMVMNYSRLLSGDHKLVEDDVRAVVETAGSHGAIVKVILETCFLTDEQKVIACQLCEKAGADFVKTSTGFGTGGATIADLELMRRSVSPKVKVKAAGGVRTLDAALQVRKAGAVRFGATATETIMEEAKRRQNAGTLAEDPIKGEL